MISDLWFMFSRYAQTMIDVFGGKLEDIEMVLMPDGSGAINIISIIDSCISANTIFEWDNITEACKLLHKFTLKHIPMQRL